MPMGKGYSHKVPYKAKKGMDYKNGGDKGFSGAGVPVGDNSLKQGKTDNNAAQAGYGKANVVGSKAKTFC
jgi:hypothetical protein